MFDFDKICRTCSSEGELQSLFITDPILISDMLYQITNLKVNKDDNFPQNICTYCVDQLKTAYYFMQQCHDVNTKLIECLNQQNDCKLEENDENIIEMKIENESEKFSSYTTNFEFYIDNTDSMEGDNLNIQNDLIKCEICLKSLRPDNFRRHLKRHTAEPLHECFACKKKFISKIELKVHLRKHTDFKPFGCQHCDKSFKQRRSLLHHLNVTHLDIIREKFPIKKRLKVHRTVECNICSKPVGSNNLLRHLQTHNRIRPFNCSICGKSFTQKVQLQIHMRIHTGEMPFKCNHCDNSFRQRTSLFYHLKVHHKEEIKPSPNGKFECNKCEEKFSNKIILASHKMFHAKGTRKTNNRPTVKTHLCNYCGAAFLTISQLQDHIGTHTGEKRHKCDVCGKSFAAYSSLDVHRRRHLNVKPHICKFCAKSFVTSRELKRHELIHTDERPFTCKICDKSFRQRTHLKYHNSTHTGDKPHTCNLCAKSFVTSGELQRHGLIHTDERPFTCKICDKSFRQRTHLKNHSSSHTSSDKQITCPECDKEFYDVRSMNQHKKTHFKHLILNDTENEHAYV